MTNSSMNMSENLGMSSSEPHELKLGTSFCNQSSLYHTIRYDFKPASVDVNKMATVEVNDKNPKEVLVTVPHTDGAGVTHTVFKGSQSPIRRDCVLIIDKITGEITLEKLHTNIIVKKTRPETASKLSIPHPEPISHRKPSPKHPKVRGNASPKPPNLGCIPKHSPLHASPNPSLPMIGEEIDSGFEASAASGSHGYNSSTPASEASMSSEPKEHYVLPKEHYVPPKEHYVPPKEHYVPPKEHYVPPKEHYVPPKEHYVPPKEHRPTPEEPRLSRNDSERYKPVPQMIVPSNNGMEDLVGVLSDSSSGDSSSDGDSSDSSSDAETSTQPTSQARSTGPSMPSAVTLLNDDLQLSDSGSDSD